jgi:hypothetical protein
MYVSGRNNAIEEMARLNSSPVSAGEPFQSRIMPWLLECFGETIASETVERNHRFLEEALELVQACGCPSDEAHKLVDYVYGRPVGDKSQEVGGVMVTLAALCLAQGLDMHQSGETELARITQPAMVERIREKQKRKPAMSPLPGVYPERAAVSAGVVDERAAFVQWITTSHGDVFDKAIAEHYWEKEHVSALSWQARAALSANHSEQVLDDYVQVPKVATLDMKNAGWQEISRQGIDPEMCEMQPIYYAMLAAAPSAGSQGGQ